MRGGSATGRRARRAPVPREGAEVGQTGSNRVKPKNAQMECRREGQKAGKREPARTEYAPYRQMGIAPNRVKKSWRVAGDGKVAESNEIQPNPSEKMKIESLKMRKQRGHEGGESGNRKKRESGKWEPARGSDACRVAGGGKACWGGESRFM